MYKKVESTQPPRFSGGSSRENREKWYYQAKPCASCGPAIPIKVTTYMAKPLIFQYANEKGSHLTGFIEKLPNPSPMHCYFIDLSCLILPKWGNHEKWPSKNMVGFHLPFVSPLGLQEMALTVVETPSFFRENPFFFGDLFKWSENLGLKTWPPFFGAKVQVTWKLARHLDKHDSGDQARSN